MYVQMGYFMYSAVSVTICSVIHLNVFFFVIFPQLDTNIFTIDKFRHIIKGKPVI